MSALNLLPLGTIVKGKNPASGWEMLRWMVTGYYPVAMEDGECFDYAMTPWPLGYINIEGGEKKTFYSCNEEAIELVEFFGAVDSFSETVTNQFYEATLKKDEFTSPLAQGVEPMMHSYGNLPVTIGNLSFGKDEILPLGTVISTAKNGSQKGMIYQHGGTYRGKHYDYGVCAWPEGADPGSDIVQLINHDEITAVHFRGYENALSQEVTKRLEKKRRGSLFTRLFGGR